MAVYSAASMAVYSAVWRVSRSVVCLADYSVDPTVKQPAVYSAALMAVNLAVWRVSH